MKESVEKAVNHLTINLLTAYQCSSYLQQCQDKIKDKIKTNKNTREAYRYSSKLTREYLHIIKVINDQC